MPGKRARRRQLVWAQLHRQRWCRVAFTYKLFSTGEIEELDEAEVVSGHRVEAGVRDAGTVDVGLLGVTRPNAEDLVPHDAEEPNRNTLIGSTSPHGL